MYAVCIDGKTKMDESLQQLTQLEFIDPVQQQYSTSCCNILTYRKLLT